MQRALLTLFLLEFTCYFQVSVSSGVGYLQLKSYSNPEYKDSNDRCCEHILSIWCSSHDCDPYFDLCLGTPTDKCSLVKYQTNVYTDTDTINFGPSLSTTSGTKANPILFTFPDLKGGLVLGIRIQDHDDGNDADDPIGNIQFTFTNIPGPYGRPNNVTKDLSNSKAKMTVAVSIMCDEFYYGDCSVYCKRDAQRYDCDKNGNKICFQDYTGKDCDIDTNTCRTAPCDNGGTCVNSPNSFSCLCPMGFTGAFCELKTPSAAATTKTASPPTTTTSTTIKSKRTSKPTTTKTTTQTTTTTTTPSRTPSKTTSTTITTKTTSPPTTRTSTTMKSKTTSLPTTTTTKMTSTAIPQTTITTSRTTKPFHSQTSNATILDQAPSTSPSKDHSVMAVTTSSLVGITSETVTMVKTEQSLSTMSITTNITTNLTAIEIKSNPTDPATIRAVTSATEVPTSELSVSGTVKTRQITTSNDLLIVTDTKNPQQHRYKSNKDTPSDSDSKTGVIAGLVVGILIICAAGGALLFYFVLRKRFKIFDNLTSKTNPPESSPTTSQEKLPLPEGKTTDKSPTIQETSKMAHIESHDTGHVIGSNSQDFKEVPPVVTTIS